VIHAIEIGALGNDAEPLVHGQNFCRASSEDRLRIGQDEFLHDVRLTCIEYFRQTTAAYSTLISGRDPTSGPSLKTIPGSCFPIGKKGEILQMSNFETGMNLLGS
jgi:hypothetical protein